MKRLVRAIESLASRDEEHQRVKERVGRIRPLGAAALHGICRKFVDAINGKLAIATVTLDPPDWFVNEYRGEARNLIQINVRGRLLLIEFGETENPLSTEDFRKPYTLEGSVRCFNQDLLESNRIDEQQIYFCPKGDAGDWYFFDRRLYQTGKLGEDFLVRELRRLL